MTCLNQASSANVLRCIRAGPFVDGQNYHPEACEPSKEKQQALISHFPVGSVIALEQVGDILNHIQDRQLPIIFFKGIDPVHEFGVSRLISDRVYHLPKLLEKLELFPIQKSHYKLCSFENTTAGMVGLEYHFEASSNEEAQKIAEIFKQKITGVGERLWLVCWEFANEMRNWLFEVNTIDLFKKCYPKRLSHPNGEERKDFLSLIRLLERTKFVLTRNMKKSPITYELPIIQIIARSQASNGWHRRLELQVLHPDAHKDKMAHVGTPFQKSTICLDSADLHLATTLQIRHSQVQGQDILCISLEDLIELANLKGTAKAKMAQAKKLLLAKLGRLKGNGIIKSYSCRLPLNQKEKVHIGFHKKLGVEVTEVGVSSYRKG